MRGNIAQLMQQAQKMQENMQRAQEELAKLEVTGQRRRRHGQRHDQRPHGVPQGAHRSVACWPIRKWPKT